MAFRQGYFEVNPGVRQVAGVPGGCFTVECGHEGPQVDGSKEETVGSDTV